MKKYYPWTMTSIIIAFILFYWLLKSFKEDINSILIIVLVFTIFPAATFIGVHFDKKKE